jgi:CspA family cold shock protein
LHGQVTAFDDDAGLGTITADDGTAFAFHCTQIADGSRTIEVGAEADFDLLARLGGWEATTVTPAGSSRP